MGELRSVASGIARILAAAAQVRALETLARQRLADPQSLLEIARLFPAGAIARSATRDRRHPDPV
ncbi:MAG: hypothetical protein IPP44_30655 [Ideonella sp.]|nr:hypothetical protein [Ideonella sp.]